MNREEALKLVKKVAETYENIATHFSQTRSYLWQDFAYFAPFLAESQSLLDIGCGNGRLIEMLKGKNINYTGIDISQNLIKEAIGKWSSEDMSMRFIQMNLMDIDSLENQYDVITCIGVMHHLPKVLHQEFLEKVYTKLKPGGVLLMTNWNLNQLHFWKTLLSNAYRRIFRLDNSFGNISLGFNDVTIGWTNAPLKKTFPRYVYRFTKNYLDKTLSKTGFNIIKSNYVRNGELSSVLNGKNILHIAKK